MEAIALQRLLPKRGDLLLEVGAGAGRNTPRYQGFGRVALVDYSLTQLQQARQRLGNGGLYLYVAANAYRLPFLPEVFDAATMIRTLHHMADPPLALQQVRLAIKSGGAFILEYANKQNLKAILRYLLRRQDWSPFSHEPVEFAALNFDFHPAAEFLGQIRRPFSKRSGGTEGRPLSAYIWSKTAESRRRAPSASTLIPRSGWSFGTRASAEIRHIIED